MANKHTQGTWTFNGQTDIKAKSEYMNQKGEIKEGFIHVANVSILMKKDEAEANAKLIAASPELLEVLNKINLALLLSSELDKSYWSKIAQQAIDKATK